MPRRAYASCLRCAALPAGWRPATWPWAPSGTKPFSRPSMTPRAWCCSSPARPTIRHSSESEVNRAFRGRKPIYTFRLEDITPSGSLDFYLAQHHWMDGFAAPLESSVDELAKAVTAGGESPRGSRPRQARRGAATPRSPCRWRSSSPSPWLESGCGNGSRMLPPRQVSLHVQARVLKAQENPPLLRLAQHQ